MKNKTFSAKPELAQTQGFRPSIRAELLDDYRVFYVTAWGYAADHWLGWFPKALNSHPELFALLAHEGSRPKYFTEITRGERPDLCRYTEFLNDMSMTYQFIGDCYSWRAVQTNVLQQEAGYRTIPVVNLVRHPAAWLEFYVRWRADNMRMRQGSADPLLWEWKVARHRKFQALNLKPYEKEDVDIWASHQGMVLLSGAVSDLKATPHHFQIERTVNDPVIFQKILAILTRDRIQFSKSELERAYEMVPTLFRGEKQVAANPETLMESWPGWKVDAFRKLVPDRTLEVYKNHGYSFETIERKPFAAQSPPLSPTAVSKDIFVSTLMKSGTWLLREIVKSITALQPFEPEIDGKTPPGYDNEMKIEFPPGCFFIWHSEITSRTRSLLAGSDCTNLYLVRNIYDLLVSMTNHLQYDVDAGIGRSTNSKGVFDGISDEQSLSMMINGFTSPHVTWGGLRPHIRQMASMIRHARDDRAHLIFHEDMVNNRPDEIRRIAKILDVDLSEAKLMEIFENTSPEQMQIEATNAGAPDHITPTDRHSLKDHVTQSHIDMVNYILWQEFPDCLEPAGQKELADLFTLRGEPLRLPGSRSG
ncbi:MAG: sulfotransferase domain-containing protein [Alphaproteobacteria bacterium]